MLAIDTSLSMNATDIAPNRLDAAIAGATSFVDELPAGIEVGLVAFDSDARLLVSPTTDHDAVKASIATLTTDERTATGEAIYTSLDAVTAALADERLGSTVRTRTVPAAVVLLSDGVETVGRSVDDAAAAATDADVPVSTIAYGTPDRHRDHRRPDHPGPGRHRHHVRRRRADRRHLLRGHDRRRAGGRVRRHPDHHRLRDRSRAR